MDGPAGEAHPESGATIAGVLFGKGHRDLVLLHSRRYAVLRRQHPSKLCWADKLSILYEPDWFYLARARASGELDEYRRQAVNWVSAEQSDREWLIWIKRRFAKAALTEVRQSRKARCDLAEAEFNTPAGSESFTRTRESLCPVDRWS